MTLHVPTAFGSYANKGVVANECRQRRTGLYPLALGMRSGRMSEMVCALCGVSSALSNGQECSVMLKYG